MTHLSKLLLGASAIALLGGCSMFKSDSASSSSSSPPSRTASAQGSMDESTAPKANTTPMTKPAPVDGTSSASAGPGTGSAHAADAQDTAAATGAIKLSEVKNPKETLANVTVKDSKGEAVGEVKSVKVAASGKLTAIRVAVGTRTVALKLSTLTFDQAENTITSRQSKAEIQKIR